MTNLWCALPLPCLPCKRLLPLGLDGPDRNHLICSAAAEGRGAEATWSCTKGLVLYTFGNASAFPASRNWWSFKPVAFPTERSRKHLVVTDLAGKIVEGRFKAFSDLPTHLVLYQAFPGLAGCSHPF